MEGKKRSAKEGKKKKSNRKKWDLVGLNPSQDRKKKRWKKKEALHRIEPGSTDTKG